MNKSVIALSLALSVSLLINLATGLLLLKKAPDETDHRARLEEVEKRHIHEMAGLEESHRDQLQALQTALNQAVEEKKTQLETLKGSLSAAKSEALHRARSSPKALQGAIAKATGAKKEDIRIDAGSRRTVLPKEAAENWLDLTLSLKNDLALCSRNCELRLAKQKQALVPRWTMMIQEKEVQVLGLKQINERLRLDNEYLERKLRAAKGDVLTWSLISGAIGLAVGATGAGVAMAYAGR